MILMLSGSSLNLTRRGAEVRRWRGHCRAPHDGALAGLGEHRADGLDPVEALGDEDALHLAAVGQVLLEPHLRAAPPNLQLVVTSRCGASHHSSRPRTVVTSRCGATTALENFSTPRLGRS